MMPIQTVYIALGSNKGLKFEYLQHAVNLIFERIGAIRNISRVYRTPAIGFNGEEFLNACIKAETNFKPKKVLSILLDIERDIGRVRGNSATYQSREIDLDILFFEDLIVEERSLVIPHPRAHLRKFVLGPMLDIDKDYKHPVFNKNIEKLLEECADDSQIEPLKIWLKNPQKSYNFSAHNYIAIEGNIGAGKTSLTQKIAHDFNAKLILERFADNPFLPKFYKEPDRYAFTLEMSFLADRYQQISDDLSQLDLFKDFILSDYDVYKSLIFSKITLASDEFRLYRKLFYQVYKDISKPDLYIYLYQSTERLQENIRKRGRKYENEITDDYLERINAGYIEFLRNQKDINVKLIDISDKDFVKRRADYLWILKEICD